MVGTVGLEPTTSASRTLRATKLRYVPMKDREYLLASHRANGAGSRPGSLMVVGVRPLDRFTPVNGRHGSLGLSCATVRRAPLVLLLCLALCLTALPASADALDSAVAATRGSALATQGDAEATANASAARQAANGAISHASIGHLTSVCTRAAEIVGAGPSIDMIFGGFRASPNHISYLVDPGWTSMGTGLATGADGTLYVSVVFCQGSAATPPPAPAPAPPAPAPAPPAPAPTPPAGPTPTPVRPAPAGPSVSNATTAEQAPVATIEVDIMGLITAVLSTSLDSLTAEPDVDTPMGAVLQRFIQLDHGFSII